MFLNSMRSSAVNEDLLKITPHFLNVLKVDNQSQEMEGTSSKAHKVARASVSHANKVGLVDARLTFRSRTQGNNWNNLHIGIVKDEEERNVAINENQRLTLNVTSEAKIRTTSDTSCLRCLRGIELTCFVARIVFIITMFLLIGCPVRTAADDGRESVALREGITETLTFHLEWLLDLPSGSEPAYTIQIESETVPFYIFDSLNQAGLKDPGQFDRFSVITSYRTEHSLTVNLIIRNVSVKDEGIYILRAFVHSKTEFKHITLFKNVTVYSPVGKAQCFIIISDYSTSLREIHCRARSGTRNATLICFQNQNKLPYKGSISDNGHFLRAVFWMTLDASVSCCSHETHRDVTQASCLDFERECQEKKRSSTTLPSLESTYSRSTASAAEEIHVGATAGCSKLCDTYKTSSIVTITVMLLLIYL